MLFSFIYTGNSGAKKEFRQKFCLNSGTCVGSSHGDFIFTLKKNSCTNVSTHYYHSDKMDEFMHYGITVTVLILMQPKMESGTLNERIHTTSKNVPLHIIKTNTFNLLIRRLLHFSYILYLINSIRMVTQHFHRQAILVCSVIKQIVNCQSWCKSLYLFLFHCFLLMSWVMYSIHFLP